MSTRWFEVPSWPGLAHPFSLFDSLFGDELSAFPQARSSRAASVTAPRFVSEEHDEGFVLRADLPGVSEKDLEITVHQGTLTISGQRRIELPEGYQARHRERSAMRFARTLRLSDEMDAERIEARMQHGVLTLSIPKRPEVQPRQIPVKTV